jgi:hypothetical protein
MNESEWLSGVDPRPMLEFLRAKATDRKLRLFAVASGRCVRELMQNDLTRQLVEVAELDADGLGGAAERQLEAIWNAYWDDLENRQLRPGQGEFLAYLAALGLWRAQVLSGWLYQWASGAGTEGAAPGFQCWVLHDLFGNPFRPVALDPAWFRWNDGLVIRLAQAIYDDKNFEDLPVLADALEEAGCTDPEILGHCRGGGEHVRGCWAVDLILGKE